MTDAPSPPLWSGQTLYYDAAGPAPRCGGGGQDAALRPGRPWPVPRFEDAAGGVRDRLTGLVWCRDANPAEFPLTWPEALDFVAEMNLAEAFGHRDWRLPNRRELRSLISHQDIKPALPAGHPFANVLGTWYWTSTTAAIAPAHAWYVDMDGGRLFYGRKDQSFLTWPVCGDAGDVLPATGQTACYDVHGTVIDCARTGQDAEQRRGAPWPVPRFVTEGQAVRDRLTGLTWLADADLTDGPVSWGEALDRVARLDRDRAHGRRWRLPAITELESVVDAGSHGPALPADHPFARVRDHYWSATTSAYEPSWAWALYLRKGAVGVGMKSGRHFHVWPLAA